MMKGLKKEIVEIAEKAREAANLLRSVSTAVKDEALTVMAQSLRRKKGSILTANRRDIRRAKEKNLSNALIERLRLTDKRIEKMAQGLEQLTALPDPVGETVRIRRRPNGLRIRKVRVPIGVIGIIYEARPNVTCDCAGLCLKAGNSVILKGGREAVDSNSAVYDALVLALKKCGLPEGAVSLIQTTERRAVDILLGLDEYLDLIIPRGGEGLIRLVARKSRIPVIKHYKGVCHTYVDEDADLDLALKVCFNAKVQRPGVCNAMESMLVHRGVAKDFLPAMIKKMKEAGVEIRGCPLTRKIVGGVSAAKPADWSTEYLDLILSAKVIKDVDEAIAHISRFGSRHSDAIITRNSGTANKFLKEVDSACVYVNASTRFTDGGEFGMGAEIGISTDKIHARGPMGLEELTIYKYVIYGSGQVRN